MFLEAPNMPGHAGWIEVVCGSMFSGKTEELIRRLKRAQIARQRIELYKPSRDTRYHESQIVSHEGRTIPSTPVTAAQQILLLTSPDVAVVGIDEAQFFDEAIVEVANELANRGVRVVAAGLDMDYRGRPFGPMPQLLAIAEYVTKLHAICTRTGGLAHFSHRTTGETDAYLLGHQDHYEPLSRAAFLEAGKQDSHGG
ncbi:MAG: thymidine kinase [Bacteroidetes bacterium]|nr:thymidine kinase [Bacteroidota bacterium]